MIVSIYLFRSSLGDKPAEFFPQVIGLFVICVGAFFLGRRMLSDQAMKSGGSDGTLAWILVGAVTLSAVSFSTTMFGMADFASQQNSSFGEYMVGWFISLGTTFGIQIIMLYIALKLGEQLVRLRPTYDDRFQFGITGVKKRDAIGWGKATMIGFAMLLMGVAFMVFLQISIADIGSFFMDLAVGGDIAPRWVGLLPLSLAILALIAVGVIRNLWGFVTTGFLLAVYAVTLFISSLFSFDSYYKLVQDDEDIAQRRASIIEEITIGMLNDAGRSLGDAPLALLETPENRSALREAELAVDTLQAERDTVSAQLLQQQTAGATAAKTRRDALNDALAELDQEEADEIKKVTNRSTAGVAIAQDIRSLEPQITGLTAQSDEITTELQAKRDEIAVLDAKLKCEETGFKGPPHCEQSSGVANPPNFDPATRPGTVSGQLFLSKAKVAGEIQQLEAQLATTAAELVALGEQKTALEISLQLAQQAVDVDAQGNSAALQEITEIKQRFDTEREALRARFSLDGGASSLGAAGPASLDELVSRLTSFRNDPNNDTLAAWTAECNAVRQSLVRANAELAASLNCQPPRLSSIAQRGTDIAAAKALFVESGCTTTADTGAAPRSAPPNQTELRLLTGKTRSCLNIANRGQDDVRQMISDLTELESVYLSDETDIRRSVADFRRGADNAKGAAIGAITIDMLILVVGFLAALSANSSLYGNPLKPMPDEVQASICAFARNFSGDGTVETGLRRFLRYVEARRLDTKTSQTEGELHEALFRNTLNRETIRPEDKDLVNAIMTAIPLGYLKEVSFVPPRGSNAEKGMREGISQSVIKMMYEIAFKGPAASPSGAIGAQITDMEESHRLREEEQEEKAMFEEVRRRLYLGQANPSSTVNTDAPPPNFGAPKPAHNHDPAPAAPINAESPTSAEPSSAESQTEAAPSDPMEADHLRTPPKHRSGG
ncbi:hypothetical protein [Tropicibacter oceani]|uniref:Uncharacterized protein n=1 Tax=Tropicibacter oceani TaxID=3058420 RepID=A0ABY8QHZ3_9RHOB|nr:hypothetical protein [Tropicibacter oceani]WGW03588.1 hypothetical protein QF118_16940 [Tropicibacter oceani]